MKNFLYFLTLVAAAKALAYKKELREGVDYDLKMIEGQGGRTLDTPYICDLIPFGFRPSSLGVEIFWYPLTNTPSNPIEGYKAKLWEQERKLTWVQVEIDGVLTWVQKEELVDFPNNDVPTWTPRDENKLPGASNVSTMFYNLETEIWYDIRIQAYTLQEEGPHSLMYRIKFR